MCWRVTLGMAHYIRSVMGLLMNWSCWDGLLNLCLLLTLLLALRRTGFLLNFFSEIFLFRSTHTYSTNSRFYWLCVLWLPFCDLNSNSILLEPRPPILCSDGTVFWDDLTINPTHCKTSLLISFIESSLLRDSENPSFLKMQFRNCLKLELPALPEYKQLTFCYWICDSATLHVVSWTHVSL